MWGGPLRHPPRLLSSPNAQAGPLSSLPTEIFPIFQGAGVCACVCGGFFDTFFSCRGVCERVCEGVCAKRMWRERDGRGARSVEKRGPPGAKHEKTSEEKKLRNTTKHHRAPTLSPPGLGPANGTAAPNQEKQGRRERGESVTAFPPPFPHPLMAHTVPPPLVSLTPPARRPRPRRSWPGSRGDPRRPRCSRRTRTCPGSP